jgi:DNA polymerase III subunit alpha
MSVAKIISKKFVGPKKVYDIGVEQDHNFFIDGGIVVSNCFNRSHSLSYAVISYQTAYLKANYPVYYMAALLTSTAGDQDKMAAHLASLSKMGIKLFPPDINLSGRDFTPVGNSILYGLNAIKGLGEGTVAQILETRAINKFESISDLVTRAVEAKVKGVALEKLALCGALDSFCENRAQNLSDLKVMVASGKKATKDHNPDQTSLFADMDVSYKLPESPKTEDFPLIERLQNEKELLGSYFSGHPLVSANERLSKYIPLEHLTPLEEQEQGKTVYALCLIEESRVITTKKGDAMAFLKLEGLYCSIPAVVFPKTFDKVLNIASNPGKGAVFLVSGKVDHREGKESQLVIETLSLSSTPIVQISLSHLESEDIRVLHHIKDCLLVKDAEKEGNIKSKHISYENIPVITSLEGNNVLLGRQFWVSDAQKARNTLTESGFLASLVENN